MFLKEIVINGFKSFADRTVVRLDPGVTCIVGPNGCGKSNIVDAIRWVLGEQSAKALRGGKMHDVIFQGTDKRKPLNSCEVSLTFTDCEAELGTNFNEVEITRRVDRESGSDYFLNGKRCRLKDIHTLFMDTGVGRASYSFMMQGQIDQILSSNPQERRTIFEEAAGITKYKADRKEALNKLALVDQNLARVTDVIDEVSRKIGSLKRQAAKALRFQRFKHRLTHLDLAYNGHFYAKRANAVSELIERSTGLRGIVEQAEAKLKEAESSLERRRAERKELTTTLQEAQQTVFELRSEKENAESQAEFASIREKDVAERIENIKIEIATLEQQIEDLATKAKTAAESKAEAQELVDSSDEIFRGRNEEFERILSQVNHNEREMSQAKQQLLVREGAITRLRQQTTSLEVDLKTFQVKHAGLGDTLHELKDQQAVLEQRAADITSAQTRSEKESAAAEEAVEAARAETVRLRTEFRDLQKEISDCDREVARGQAQLSTLEALQQRFEGFSEGAKAILQGKLSELAPKDKFRPLSAVVEAEEEFTGALETLLGSSAESIHLDHYDDALPILRQLEDERIGRAVLQVGIRTDIYENENLPDWVIPAEKVIRPKKKDYATLVHDFFQGCFFVNTLDEFLEYWKTNPGFNFLFVATANNELVDHRGLVFGGYNKKGKDDSFLKRDQNIRKLKAQLEIDNEKLTQLNEKALQLQADMETAEMTVEEKRSRQQELASELASLKTDARSVQQNLQETSQNVDRQERQLGELEGSRASAEERLNKARAEMAGAEQAIEEGKAAIIGFEEALKRLQLERDAHKDGLAEVRLDLAEKKQRLEHYDQGLRDAESQRNELNTRILRRRQEVDALTEQLAGLKNDIVVNLERAAEINKTLESTSVNLASLREKSSALEKQIAEAENHLGEARSTQREQETQLNQYEVKLAEERSQSSFLADKIFSEYEREIADIDWRQELWHADEEFETKIKLDELNEDDDGELRPKVKKDRGEPTEEDFAAMEETDWPEIDKEVKYLRSRINSLGAVNLVAIEEYADERERYDFLKTQSDDLWAAKEALLKAIDEINEKSLKQFQETFEQIRKNFIFTFEKLFGGGKADLALIEAEDVLDSGIEITARPPGTKLKTLSLLSGGQRTMTAVGLLFAIYMVKPSPFAVLDELDAPLDDVNIGRFTAMVQEFVRYSQFLIVTHNKRTVSTANAIYGVTMQERGVTKLVSMRFNKKGGDLVTEDDTPVQLEPAGVGG
ncbi:chromosome segregation protein SMC [Cerasicoccus arenae]|uniref:Chromosome partition protein Smc n=1 Tax=Cerasicoccus arenae TaxID=424488 RepID=A0A8J3DCK6_9BACT|nr:chromosome segregation protein SMC [Cerasicoccus arenae]MBK1856912.1 chromosome segregation protein SMC [Cerasicoccus arenae]GHB89810.1 chromosome partition protein Smc [Cerasicoccus arenae]